MTNLLDPRYRYCAEVRRNVCIDRCEGDCREENDCGDGRCPLEQAFCQPDADSRLDHFMGLLGLR